MTRRTKIIFIIVGLAIFSYFVRSQRESPSQATNLPSTSSEVTPQPAAAATVEAQTPKKVTATPSLPKNKSKRQTSKKSASKPSKKDINSEESSEDKVNLSEKLQSKLELLVRTYAAWPGSTPKSELLKKLNQQVPFITADAVKKIENEWRSAPKTVKLTVKEIDFATGLTTTPQDPNQATVLTYAKLVKHFTPVSGDPYTQQASQPYTVKMRIFNRVWRVVEISTQAPASSSGG
jgi:hypothetical protein